MTANNDTHSLLGSLCAGVFRVTRHTRQRMDERNVTAADIQHCADNASAVIEQEGGKYLIQGCDLSNDDLQVVAAWSGEAVVISVFGD